MGLGPRSMRGVHPARRRGRARAAGSTEKCTNRDLTPRLQFGVAMVNLLYLDKEPSSFRVRRRVKCADVEAKSSER
jgi:hypothetical protein